MLLAVGCASSSSSWYLLKCSWNVGQLCSCAGSFHPRHPRMAQTPCARSQPVNVPRTLQQVPTGAITCTTHRQQHVFPQSKRQQRGQNCKHTLRQYISRHHRTCHLLRKIRSQIGHSNEPTHAATSPGNSIKYPHAKRATKPYLSSN